MSLPFFAVPLFALFDGVFNLATGVPLGTAMVVGTLSIFVLLGVLIVLLSSLTITVEDEMLQWYFGPGLFKKQLPLDQIKAVKATTHSALSGLGIRISPEGTAYTVAGGAAVRIDRTKGSSIILSTDAADGLLVALRLRQALGLKEAARNLIDTPSPERPKAVRTSKRDQW